MKTDQPQPDQIEATMSAIVDQVEVWLVDATFRGFWTVLKKVIRENLHEHFDRALRTQRAMELLDSGEVYAVKTFEEGRLWWRAARTNKRHIQLGTWHYAENLVAAVLEAAEEKKKT